MEQMESEPTLFSERKSDQSEGRLTGPVTSPKILKLIKQQNYRCALTGRELTPETAAIDHVLPVSRGGEHVMENLQVLHSDVNHAKRAMTMEEFLEMCREVVEHASKTAQ